MLDRSVRRVEPRADQVFKQATAAKPDLQQHFSRGHLSVSDPNILPAFKSIT
jgi:hypothetical protein